MTRSRAFVSGTMILLFACMAAAATPLNILLTNDDGYSATGIQILRRALVAAGHTAIIVAPRTNQSGKGTGVADAGAMLNLQFHPAENAWSVNGTPSDTVRVALEVLKLRPDVVISGVNFGENLSVFANSSGTVSASVWALNSGYPALGQLVADVTRSRYTDAAARLVLEPLGMRDSSFPGHWPGTDPTTRSPRGARP